MGTNQSDSKGQDLDALEFETVDLADAQKALDDLPPGIETVHTLVPGYWEARRRKPEVSDRALTGAALDWIIALPQSLRPAATAQAFPRIVNAIADAWSDPTACRELFDGLLHDKRPGRRGFPGQVRRELLALWDARPAEPSPAPS